MTDDTPGTPDQDARPGHGHEARPARAFDRHMLEALVCPVTHATLSYDAARQELVSRAAGLAFPIRAGIAIMLVSEARQIKAD